MALRAQTGPYFGDFGGRFVPESLVAALDELGEAYDLAKLDPAFGAELAELGRSYTGRPSIITEVPRFARHAGGARVILKREDLNHTGSHKINNVLGQALLTQRIGKSRVIAETGAGQHGVATLVTQSRMASLIASFRVREPAVTATTSAPSSRMRATLSAWRSVSSSPM